jgi:protein SCO1/2
MSLQLRDADGRARTLAEAMSGRPTLLVPVDYTCRSICGATLTIATAALRDAGLTEGRDYSLIVFGIDAKDTPEDARNFARSQIGDAASASVLLGDADAIRALETSIGYRAVYDAENDQFAHPAGIVALARDGRVVRVLSSLALTPQDLRLALVDASEGHGGGLVARLSALCYGFDPVHGVYTLLIDRILAVAGAVTIALLGGGLLLLRRATRHIGQEAPPC